MSRLRFLWEIHELLYAAQAEAAKANDTDRWSVIFDVRATTYFLFEEEQLAEYRRGWGY